MVKSKRSVNGCSECSHCRNRGFSSERPTPTPSSLPVLPSVSESIPHGTGVLDTEAAEGSSSASLLHFEEEIYGSGPSIPKGGSHALIASSTSESSTMPFAFDDIFEQFALSPSYHPEIPTHSSAQGATTELPHDCGLLETGALDLGLATSDTEAKADIMNVSKRRSHNSSQTEAAMHLAAREGRSAILSILLRNGASVDSLDADGRTPLHNAAENGHAEAVHVLLAAGADPTAVDNEGSSVILTAVRGGREDVVEILLGLLKD